MRRILRGDFVCGCAGACRRVLANPLRQRPPGGPSEVGKGNLGGLTCPTRRARDAEATLSARLMHVKNRTLRWAEPWLR